MVLSNSSSWHRPGTLWGIGVGPGDPELLTLKAAHILHTVHVIAYLVHTRGAEQCSLARKIVAAVLDDGVQRIELALNISFSGDRASASSTYDYGANIIAQHLMQGSDVAVLCEGDPLFFGSFSYILQRLANKFPVEIIPGVNSVSACSALIKQPFSLSDDRTVIVPAILPSKEIESALTWADSIAIVKIGRYFSKVVTIIDKLGLTEKAWYIAHAGQEGQEMHNLASIMEKTNHTYFSMVLIHKKTNREMYEQVPSVTF